MDKTKAQELLDKAASLQPEYWKLQTEYLTAIRRLEFAIDTDIDERKDLAGLTVEELLERES